jgi:G3E family GTPase
MMVSHWLAEMRRVHGENLLRVKGILNLAGEAAPVAIHGVHHVFHPPVLLNAWTDDDRRSRIVFITRGLAQQEIEDGWQRLCAARQAEASTA